MQWKDIEDYPNYKVSSTGEVLNKRRGFLLKSSLTSKGYVRVGLYVEGKVSHKFVHRLVAEAFIPNPEGKEFINHIDKVRDNNVVNNLEWCTIAENNRHSCTVDYKFMKGGEVVSGNNLSELSRATGVDVRHLSAVHTGALKRSHGFTKA